MQESETECALDLKGQFASGVSMPLICTGLAENAYRVEVNVE